MLKNSLSLITLITICLISFTSTAQNVVEPKGGNPEWSQLYPPFRIAGNLYYVGTYDLACYLIVTPKGNILINTGLAASAPLIKESIETLGFKFTDTKILLTTQAHYDHMGAMAEIKKLTGAQLMVDEKDAGVLEDGGVSDYALGKSEPAYQPVKADRLLKDRDVITLGSTKLTLLHHPGHTKGSCSFLFDVKDEKKTYKVLIANLPTIVTDKKFNDIPAYPEVAKDYAYTFDAMKKLSFDLWVASHASQFDLHEKHKPDDDYNPEVFNDRKGYDQSLNELEASYIKKMEQK